MKFQSVIDKPECVKRVKHPTTTMIYTNTQPVRSQRMIALSGLCKLVFSIMVCKITQHLNTKKINPHLYMKNLFFQVGDFD